MQAVWCALGFAACAATAVTDYRHLRRLSWVVYGATLLVLVLVLVPHIGMKINGARRWIALGPLRFQPSEFAKLGLILVLAAYIDRFQRQMPTFKRGLLIPGAIIAGIVGLVFVEPDRGTSILLAAVGGMMLVVAGVRVRILIGPVVLAVLALAYSIWNDPMRLKRIFSWIYLEENKDGVGYQAYQAMLALGQGGWFGLGLGNGRQKLGFVPEHHTDFIFSIIGEELGLIATIGVVLMFILLVICGLYIAWHAREPFGFYLGCGVTFLIGLQTFINIGVVTSVLPNKGLSLPFISYGGSSLLVMLTAVGLMLSVARRGVIHSAKSRNPFGNKDIIPAT
jgi:cell division protein FtsW